MTAPWTTSRAAAVAIGGVLGATTRALVLDVLPPSLHWPWPVLGLNVVGSFVLGVAMAQEWRHPGHRVVLHDGVGIGFCGGLTTFSTLALEVAQQLDSAWTGSATTYLLTSVVAAVIAVLAGAAVGRNLRAPQLPLEGEP